MLAAIIRITRFFKSPRIALTWSTEFIEDRIRTRLHKNHLEYYTQRQLPLKEGLIQATGVDSAQIEKYLTSLPEFLTSANQDTGMKVNWSATSELAAASYVLIRILKPDIVIETGVGAGVSSWTILHALEENNGGRLISIDLPTPNSELLPDVGYLVPKTLRHRWNLRIGASQKLLPQILSELGEIDIFLHDSRHSYSNQIREYQCAWPFIKRGGMLVSDDISNDALHDVSQLWNREPSIIQQSKDSPIGLVKKF
tara:strand:- start:1922 stop:2686 length:765 start_codon:yes stop_codon:yes gene_type:complete